ncbi:hypothetical protein DBR32_03625 [Taibaiella sp. KBW10]|uniref:gliding motility-associated C-terminal domain-containing protein n=1 Tax=Taibaiella sp. KBW10 TaxID=2153357 RepID=UPI000F5A3EF3|nr:gliding motility-associated C-terminal domain-containing protein [Taibaiella sp. KBW10]RQO31907.1 hypothetical protein DBR32_03625 [Taibaiella sp. KBW10]
MKLKCKQFFYSLITCMLLGTTTWAQLPQCDHIYMDDYLTNSIVLFPGFPPFPISQAPTGNIYGYNPALPTSATNPALNTIQLPANYIGGITVSEVLNSGSPTLTFYCVTGNANNTTTWRYSYYNPVTSAWVNTGHNPGPAPNIAGGGGFLYSLNGGTGEVYKYNGTGNATLLLDVPGFTNEGPYDLIADCEGDWYILNLTGTNAPPFLRKYSATGALMQSWTVNNPNGYQSGAGFGILGTTIYVDAVVGTTGQTGMAMGTIGTTAINFTSISPGFPSTYTNNVSAFQVEEKRFYDMATCAGAIPALATIAITANPASICSGALVNYTSVITSGGTAPQYQWFVNGIAITGATGATFSHATNTGDKITCRLTSNSPCVTEPVAMSPVAVIDIVDGTPPKLEYSHDKYCRVSNTKPVNFSPAGGTFSSSSSGLIINPTTGFIDLENSAVGAYTVSYATIGNAGCPSKTVTVPLTITPNPTITISTVTDVKELCETETIELRATNIAGAQYAWGPNKYFERTLSEGQKVTANLFPGRNKINVWVTDVNGCIGTDTITLVPKPCCELMMPNAFTPNSDGKNDYFTSVSKVEMTIVNFTVFNRWGTLVYEGSGNKAKWDGMYEGKPAEAGTYVYHISYNCSNGVRYEKKGDITLIR